MVATEVECAVGAWEEASDQPGAGLVVVMEEALVEVLLVSAVAALAVVAALAEVALVEGAWEYCPTTKS